MPKRKKLSKLQIFRIIVQIIFFIILPGLYANAFAGIKIIYQGIITGNFSLYNEFPSLLAAISIFPITIILGRFFCGWVCAFGSLGDWLFESTNKIFKYKKRVPQNIDNVLKLLKYIVLFLFFAFIWNMDLSELDAANPWISFGLLAKVTQTPDLANAVNGFMAGTIILVIIMVISIFVERFFCRYLCPLGALFTLISVLGITKISKPKSNCGSCRLCTNKCSMGINLDKYDVVKSGECIQCYKCVSVCPKSNASPSVFKKKMSGSYAGSIAVLSITVIFYFFTMITGVFVSGSSNAYLTNQIGTGQYIDGIYEGSGQGFRGETIVSVTITNGFISNIEVISYNDDTEYFDRAFNAVSSSIISSQKTIVDGVSGATYSSQGIMAAVENALENAKNIVAEESTTSEMETTSQTETTSQQSQTTTGANNQTTTQAATTTTAQTIAQQLYADGTYSGTGTGYRGGTTILNVTITGGRITNINVVSYQDDAPYFNQAFNTVVSSIINNQSSSVNGVSGATFSSNGIKSAVSNALSQALN